MDVFSVLSRHMDWLGQRQSVLASNIANADTPGYRARRIAAFDMALGGAAAPSLAGTSASHLNATPGQIGSYDVAFEDNTETSLSGNNVQLEKEMAGMGDTSRQLSFDAGLARMFQHMLISSLKG